ncbi:MAG: hypothetical protein AB7F96_08130 [Beijerinckiaceae bacterium]
MTQTQTRNLSKKAAEKPAFRPGPVRVKFLPPSIEEAVEAARDIAEDDIDGQIEIAASLMGVEPAEVRDEVLRLAEEKKRTEAKIQSGSQVMVRDKTGGARAVVVQRTGRASRAVVVERSNRFGAAPRAARPGTIRTFDLTRRPGS